MPSRRSLTIAWHIVRGVGAIVFGIVIARISPPTYDADGLSGYSVLLLVGFTVALCTFIGAVQSLRWELRPPRLTPFAGDEGPP